MEEYEGVLLGDVVDQRSKCPETMRPSENDMMVDIPEGDFQRWKLLIVAQLETQELADSGVSHLSDRLNNFPRLDAILENKWLCLWLTITGLAYGGLHCLAWNAPFPRKDEQILWRMSSPAVASTGVLALLLFSWEYSPPYWRGDEGGFSAENWPWVGESVAHFNRSHWLAKVVIRPLEVVVKLAKMLIDGFIIPGVVLFYCMARVFLVVECFITLEHLPASVYNVPLWSNYLPHIS